MSRSWAGRWKGLFAVVVGLVILSADLRAASVPGKSVWRMNATIRGDQAGAPARTCFLRRETPRVVLQFITPTNGIESLQASAVMRDPSGVLWSNAWKAVKIQSGINQVQGVLDLSGWRVGRYDLAIVACYSETTVSTNLELWVCPEPDRAGFMFGMLDEQIRQGTVLEDHLQELKKSGIGGVMHYQPTPELMERCLWQRMNGMSISHGYPGAGGFKEDPDAIWRLNASGMPFEHDPAKKGSGRRGIAHTGWQDAVAVGLGENVLKWAAYPGYYPMINTSDDYYRWTGLDYHSTNLFRFKQKYGIDAPRPPEALKADFPFYVARETGIIPDNDPWVLWMEFNSRDVLGRYNGLLADAVRRVTDGRGRIGPVPGGGPWTLGTVPLVDMPSGQWPPYNFGPNGFSLISYYNYNCYWFPAIAQAWWAETARMGNRDLPVWVMPDTMDLRPYYHFQNALLFLAGGVDGMVYFIYELTKPAARESLGRIGPQIARNRSLLAALRPASRPIGLLLPFETASFRSSFPADTAYAFANLVMAHAEVEPVWPEELDARRNRYKAILLADVDWLKQANHRRLQEFQKQGGRVIADSASAVEWPGVERLGFALADPRRTEGYGNTNLIGQVRALTDSIVKPWAQSDDPHIFLRHYQCGGADYLWVVHLMNHADDRRHIPSAPGQEFKNPVPDEFKEIRRKKVNVEITVPGTAGRSAWDVLNARAVLAEDREPGFLKVSLELPYWEGTLLAFYPTKPGRIELDFPGKVKRGQHLKGRLTILDDQGRVPMSLPVTVEVIQPDGTPHPDFGGNVLAREGIVRFDFDLAGNESVGEWIIRAKEETTGLGAETRFQVR